MHNAMIVCRRHRLAKVALNKTIEAKKLSKTGFPLPGPETTIPFGAIVDRVERDRDDVRFRYLMEAYLCPYDLLASAVDPGALDEPSASDGDQAPPAKAAPANDAPPVPHLQFEKMTVSTGGRAARAKVPGGWLVWVDPGGLTFYPDPEYQWMP